MRVSNYLKNEILNATKKAFGNSEIILFGSRVDDDKVGGDFDLAVVCDMSKDEFKKAKIQFFKYLILKDLDLPIDLVLYNKANDLLKREIDKGLKMLTVDLEETTLFKMGEKIGEKRSTFENAIIMIKDFQIAIDDVVKKLNIKKEELLEYMNQKKK